MSRDSPRSRLRIHSGGSSGWRSRVAENSAKGLHARQKASAVSFARSLPLCHTIAGFTPRAAASLASRSTASRPHGERGRRGSISGPNASPGCTRTSRMAVSYGVGHIQHSRDDRDGNVTSARPALVITLSALLLVWQPLSLATTMSGLVEELSIRGVGL